MTDEELPEKPKPEDEEDVYVIDDDSKDTSYEDLLRELEKRAAEGSPIGRESGEESGLELSGVQRTAEGEGSDSLQSEVEELRDRWTRTRADFENFKRRSEKEKREQYDIAVANTIRQLLPVVDNFDRALQSARDHAADASVIEGIEMINLQLAEILRSMSITIIDEKGVHFDPSVHEAVQIVEDRLVPPHSVVTVMQKGYKLRERLIRPAMVIVSESSTEELPQEGTTDPE